MHYLIIIDGRIRSDNTVGTGSIPDAAFLVHSRAILIYSSVMAGREPALSADKRRKDSSKMKKKMNEAIEDLLIIVRIAVYAAVCSAAWESGKFIFSVFLK